jgi:xanthine dehydrogenase accessory factor
VPAGLDLGSTTHQEIAVAVLAELVQLRASGGLVRPAAESAKRDRSAGSRGWGESGVNPVRLTQAVDPVCGMTVAAEASGRPVRHEDVDYYFCCAGCRRAFEKNPDAYGKRETRC